MNTLIFFRLRKRFFIIVFLLVFFTGACAEEPAHAANTYSADLEQGSSQYFSRADAAALSQTGSLAIDAVINAESLPGDNVYRGIVTKDTGGNIGEYNLYYGRLGTEARNFRCGFNTSGGNLYATYDIDLTVDTWYRVRCSRNTATGDIKIFVNEVEVNNTNASTAGGTDSANQLKIGQGDDAFGDGINYWDGEIDEVRIWSAAVPEITTAQEACGTEANLVVLYHYENNANDSGPNGLNLTNNNTTPFVTNVPTLTACGGGAGSSARSFLNWTSPTWEFFTSTYWHPVMFIGAGLLFLSFCMAWVKLYQGFREWYTRKRMGF